MNRPVAIVGAPSSIGIRPYDTGEARHLDRAPGVLRQLQIVERLGAVDMGDVTPPVYRDYVRPPGRARNEQEVLAY
jgi:arginase